NKRLTCQLVGPNQRILAEQTAHFNFFFLLYFTESIQNLGTHHPHPLCQRCFMLPLSFQSNMHNHGLLLSIFTSISLKFKD
ncbi:hypothetical protein VIGAN_10197600, partial [Vigna angularis var. angularis]